ncbi:RNA polymerase sporulation sigma factor SigG [Clostridium estertheticum]|uniref:RNA polymerase sporulation sigma factor SigG n=1 Tax=Clostridium estertheticum TaxID=238834 RepID=UPI0013E91F89|nr:RNA polymerase sporulation sigma factor SigG [Clostridium estertheticum]MBZ9687796.1 RNA polymerase sporulation sigma factor SigG [Clostridium estertheticum]
MMNNKVEICGVNSSKLQVLKEKEMKELLFRVQHGDVECRETFIKGNNRLILSIIEHFNNSGVNSNDLFQIASNSLMNSIDNFDLSLNVKFSTYAVPIIIEEIRRYLSDNSPVRFSMALQDIAYSALQARDRLVKEDNKEPTISQIATELELPKEDVVFALDTLQDPVFLFEPLYHNGEDAIYVMDKIGDSKSLDDNWLEDIRIKEAMKNLNGREKLILNLRFAHGRTQMEVANEIGIPKLQVSRLEKTALKHMRKYV